MHVEIDIMDGDGSLVATAVWLSRTANDPLGSWTYRSQGKRSDRFRQLQEHISSSKEAKRLVFRTAFDDGWANAWEGLEGHIGALRFLAPILGMTTGVPRVVLESV